MDLPITKRTFTHSAAALVEYDAGQSERDTLWKTARTNEDVDAARSADEAAERKVKEAYHKDTSDINRLEDCLSEGLCLKFIRKMVAA